MRGRRLRADNANCVPGPELRWQLIAARIIRKRTQVRAGLRLENEDAHGLSFRGHRSAELSRKRPFSALSRANYAFLAQLATNSIWCALPHQRSFAVDAW